MFLQFMLICSVPNTFYVAVASRCYDDEYRVGLQCCPACPPGKHVEIDCTESSKTKCTDCTKGTFQEGRSGQKQCSNCTKCDTGLGLKVKKSCKSTSDALCEPLDGYFCTDSNRGRCMAAQRHTVCSPGQYIGQRGTADKDTECLRCTDGTFSDGTSSCQPHTICESVGQKQIKPGTDSTDSECGADPGLVAGIISGIILALIIIITIIQRKKIRAWLYRRRVKKWRREWEWNLTELAQLVHETETAEQKRNLTALAQLVLDKETPEQKRKLTERIDQLDKETAEKKSQLTEWNDQREKETPEQKKELTELAHVILSKKNKTAEKITKFNALDDLRREKETPEQKKELTDLKNLPEAGEEASDLPSPPLLSPELPAGQATSSTPATSSETQPATETTPLMSSDSPEPTSDLQEHTITSHAITFDDHDDDQSLDPLTGHPEV